MTNDLEAIIGEWLQQCGPCDAGLSMGCSCSNKDPRPVISGLVDEVEQLRASAARISTALKDFRNHADWCQAVEHAGCCQGECDCHVATFRAALDGTP